ncbi:hypothetical protein GGI20_005027 [Coemansia sp. BCRC 34301]|nr:hypothetical protein GGI20_005027 [Coemansia sp. BCRC 34301]
MNFLARQQQQLRIGTIGLQVTGSKGAAAAPRFTRAASILAQKRETRRTLSPATSYPSKNALGKPELIDRLQYILTSPTSGSSDIRQLFDYLQAAVDMATRTLDTLTQLKERRTNSGSGGRTIELEITADDLRRILALAEANSSSQRCMSSVEVQQPPQQPVARNALPTMTKHVGGGNACHSCRFASTCAGHGVASNDHKEPTQYSASGALAAATVAAALFGTGAALEQQAGSVDNEPLLCLHMSPVDVSNALFCIQ